MRIELVGGLGVGKSTLCHALELIGFHCYETLETNPFLADCYADPENFRFSSQMWFALSKFHEIIKAQQNCRINVLDQSVLNVRAYTKLLFKGGDAQALDILDRCFSYLEDKAGRADILIHLGCSPDEQLRRIKNRNRHFETGVDLQYIINLQNEISALLGEAEALNVPIIYIDTETVYLPDNFTFAEKLSADIAGLLQKSANFKLDTLIDSKFPQQYSLTG